MFVHGFVPDSAPQSTAVRCAGLGVKVVGDLRNGYRSVVGPRRWLRGLLMMFRAPMSLNRPAMRLDNSKIYEIRFRVPFWMKEDLQRYCEAHDVPVSHVLRQFIRELLLNSQEQAK